MVFTVDDAAFMRLADAVKQVITRVTEGGALTDAEFNALALEIASLQRRLNPAYRAYVQSLSQTAWTDWRAIPAVPSEAFKALDLTCLPPPARTAVFYSSGTTAAERSRHWHHDASLALYEASLKPWFARNVLPATALDRRWLMFSLTPPPELAPHSSLVHMLGLVHRQWGAAGSQFLGETSPDGAWQLDSPRAIAILEQAAAAGEPLVLMGTAFNYVHLMEAWQASGTPLRLPPGSRVMETGGYKGRSRSLPRAELHQLLQSWLGVPPQAILSEYGMCELSSQAYDTPADDRPRRFRFPPWARVRIISPETGAGCPPGIPGLLGVCDLANVWSVVAVQTADLAVLTDDGFQLLGRAAQAQPRGCSLMVSE